MGAQSQTGRPGANISAVCHAAIKKILDRLDDQMDPGGGRITVVHTNPSHREDLTADGDHATRTRNNAVHVVYNAYSSRMTDLRCNNDDEEEEDDDDVRSDNDSGIDDGLEIKGQGLVSRIEAVRSPVIHGSINDKHDDILVDNVCTNSDINDDRGITKDEDGEGVSEKYAVSIYVGVRDAFRDTDSDKASDKDILCGRNSLRNRRKSDKEHILTRVPADCDIKENGNNVKATGTGGIIVSSLTCAIRNSVMFDSEDEAKTEVDEDEGFVRFNFDDYPDSVFAEPSKEAEEEREEGERRRRRRRRSSHCILHPEDIYQPHSFSSSLLSHNIYANIQSVS